jgi:hypothetical protein
LVNAFVRVKEKERGALDFDQPGGVDTTWQRIYCCLRAGFHAEASQVAKNARELATPRAGASDLAQQVAQWGEGGCRPLGGDAGAHLSAECERLLRDKSARQRHPFSAQRAMVHALLSGNNRAAEAVVKVGVRGALAGWLGQGWAWAALHWPLRSLCPAPIWHMLRLPAARLAKRRQTA